MCVCACVRACICVCVRARVYLCVCVSTWVCLYVCSPRIYSKSGLPNVCYFSPYVCEFARVQSLLTVSVRGILFPCLPSRFSPLTYTPVRACTSRPRPTAPGTAPCMHIHVCVCVCVCVCGTGLCVSDCVLCAVYTSASVTAAMCVGVCWCRSFSC